MYQDQCQPYFVGIGAPVPANSPGTVQPMPGTGPQPAHPQLWPGGIGITDRTASPESSSCPPCFCCTQPLWFGDAQGKVIGNKSHASYCHWCTWKMNDADALGVPLSMEGKQCCGIETCYESELHMSEPTGPGMKRPIGKVIMRLPCCVCGDAEMALAKDAEGTPVFSRVEQVCCPDIKYWSGNFCGWQEYNWPVYDAKSGKAAGPLTYITYRFHACQCCYPTWVGVRHWPPGITPDHQKLLLGMAVCRWWRAEKQQNDNNNS